ncbi:YjbF family lipoprotein [Rhodobacteraceae bacterium NNCM2]|nr:YjbF family lipoprotein [Coraliihabitans acroporae]
MTGLTSSRALALGLTALLTALTAACSNDGEGNLIKIGRLTYDKYFPPAPEPRVELTRAELDQIPSALMALSVDASPRVFIVPLAKNGGYLTYMDANRRGFVMHDGAVTGTLGIGYDLDGLKVQPDDPISNQTPVAEWPGQVNRTYQYLQRDGAPYIISLTCTFERVARERIEIIERFYDVVRIAETCTNQARQVTNYYWVDAETGFIWRSTQWVSPKQPAMTLEVVRPFRKS